MNTGLQTIVKFPTGLRKQGLVLSMDRDRMRVAFPGFPDVVEFRSLSGFWVSEDGQPFEIEGLIGNCPTPTSQPCGIVAGNRYGIVRSRLCS